MASLMPLLESSVSVGDLRADELHAIIAFADAPPPALPTATEDDVREMVAFLAATLKAARTGIDGGRIKLGAYRLTLTGKPKAAIQHATETAIRTMEWMPTPAELLRLVDAYLAPEHRAHTRARYIARTMRQRAHEDRCKAIRSRSLPPDEIGALKGMELAYAITQRAALVEMDGTVIPWTLEDERRIIAARSASLGLDKGGDAPTDERDNRAEDGSPLFVPGENCPDHWTQGDADHLADWVEQELQNEEKDDA